jgi:hypothetical protein
MEKNIISNDNLNLISEKMVELILQEINNNLFTIENNLKISKQYLKSELINILKNKDLIEKNIPILND